MPAAGIIAATTNIQDDVEAISRARRAECHELRVIHNIHMKGRAVLSSFNAVGSSHASSVPVASPSQHRTGHEGIHMEGRAFQGQPSYSGMGNNAMPDRSQSDYRSVSGAQSQRYYNSTTHAGGHSSTETAECKGIWCFLRDVLLLYAVITSTALLFSYFNSNLSGSDSTSTANDVYDFIP